MNISGIANAALLPTSSVTTIAAGSTKTLVIYDRDSSATRPAPWVRSMTVGVHSQLYNLTLVKTLSKSSRRVTGRNIGLVLSTQTDSGLVYVTNPSNVSVNALVVIDQHRATDPIPGGCSSEFPLEVSPFLRLYYTLYFNRLEFQFANIGSVEDINKPMKCGESQFKIQYDIYGYFLNESNFPEREYFRAINIMSNLTTIRQYGTKLMNISTLRAYFYAYTGRPVVYNVIATSQQYSSVYVPVVTYDCDGRSIEECVKHDISTLMITTVMGLIGLFVCFRGHVWFQLRKYCNAVINIATLELIFFGLIDGSFIVYILLLKYTTLDTGAVQLYTTGAGVLLALLWVSFWKLLHLPLLSLLLSGLSLGLLLMATLLFTTIGNLELFQNDINYWLIMCCATILVTLFLPMLSAIVLSIVSSSIVGSYMAVIAVDRYIYGSLSYIMLNVMKRAVHSNGAYNTVPFQTKDVIMAAIWALLSLTGIVLQLSTGADKSPFPAQPGCCSQGHRSLTESLDRYYRRRRSQYDSYDSMESTTPSVDGQRRRRRSKSRRRSRRSKRWEPVPSGESSRRGSGRASGPSTRVVDERSPLLQPQQPYYTGTSGRAYSSTSVTTAAINPYNANRDDPHYGNVSAPPFPNPGRGSPPPDYNHLYITNTNGHDYQSINASSIMKYPILMGFPIDRYI
ncbi:unnamed protein product [Medioppia subpectinata]|uniref:TM7S3/TM198-like domain-containing protein n=1 Tax=Medioppia subpectinata TaxID=1979941 RepID=A0A7R9L524_9ACAR|nr:unnamed protein product [Medioppia subpectinata]CAG2114428.1 unnamed protein product [Medioppia subpectinata]